MHDPMIVICTPKQLGCATISTAPPARWAAVEARFAEALAHLAAAGFRVEMPVVVLDARLGRALATTVEDAATAGVATHAGHPAILFDREAGDVPPMEVVLHELMHVWLRTAGAKDARWRVEDGRLHHESALVHEGLADFVAATVMARAGGPDAVARLGRDWHVVARCPDGLTGSPHADARIVSGALWEAARNDAFESTWAALRDAAVPGSSDVQSLAQALAAAWANDASRSETWAGIVARRGLTRCAEPIHVGDTPASAFQGSFVAAGQDRIAEASSGPVWGPLLFVTRVDGASSAKIIMRVGHGDGLRLAWQAHHAMGTRLAAGNVELQGWPSSWAQVALPPETATLTFACVTSGRSDATYDDVRVELTVSTPPANVTMSPHATCSGCGHARAGTADIMMAVVAAAVAHRFRRRRAP